MNILIQNVIQAIRSLRTQGWQVAISAMSIAVGIVCLTLSANWFWADTHYDCRRPDYQNLYFMQEFSDSSAEFIESSFSYKQLEEMKREIPEDGFVMGMYRWNVGSQELYPVNNEKNIQLLSKLEMDSTTLQLLGVRTLHGSMDEVLTGAPENIAISDKVAMKLFGRTDVVGEVLCNQGVSSYYVISDEGKLRQEKRTYSNNYPIKAVFEAYEGMTNFNHDVISQITMDSEKKNTYRYSWLNCLIRTKDVDNTVKRLNVYKRHEDNAKTMYRNLYPIGIAPRMPAVLNRLNTHHYYITGFYNVFLYNIIFTLVSLLLIISAVANLVMVFTSINLGRVREYALRRSMGATSWQNVEWILIGIVPTLIIAVMFAGVIMEWILKLAEFSWDTTYVYDFYMVAVAATLISCLLGMGYPIWKMRRAYKASFLGHGDGGRSHQWLITVQCMVCAFLLYLALGMQRQLHTVLNADKGYDTENMLRLHTSDSKPEGYPLYHDFSGIYRDLAQEIGKEKGAGVTDVIAMPFDLFNTNVGASAVVMNERDYEVSKSNWGDESIKRHTLGIIEIPFRAVDFFNIRTKHGGKLLAKDENVGEIQVYINSEAADEMPLTETYYFGGMTGFKRSHDPMRNDYYGKRLNIKDVVPMRNVDCFFQQSPVMLIGVGEFYKNQWSTHDAIYIKYADGRREEAEAAVRRVLAKFDVPEDRYLLTTADEYIASRYEKNTYIANILTALTVISVIVTLSGVFSMLLYSLRLRRRSMAIHRVMGATFSDIFRPMLRPYLLYALIGSVIAYFPADMFLSQWMTYFKVGEDLGVWLMIAIFAAMCLIIFLIVWWQVSLCMKEKPVEILKPEA